MFTSQDYHNQYLLGVRGIRQDLKTCLDLLFTSKEFTNDELRFDKNDTDFLSVQNSDNTIIGVAMIDGEGRILQKDVYWEIYALKLEYDLTLQDFVGVLERVQDKLDELSIDYKSLK